MSLKSSQILDKIKVNKVLTILFDFPQGLFSRYEESPTSRELSFTELNQFCQIV